MCQLALWMINRVCSKYFLVSWKARFVFLASHHVVSYSQINAAILPKNVNKYLAYKQKDRSSIIAQKFLQHFSFWAAFSGENDRNRHEWTESVIKRRRHVRTKISFVAFKKTRGKWNQFWDSNWNDEILIKHPLKTPGVISVWTPHLGDGHWLFWEISRASL